MVGMWNQESRIKNLESRIKNLEAETWNTPVIASEPA